MSGLFDQVVNYSPPLLTAGQVNYKGTWNAATNTPGLANPPDALSKGDYYVVSAAGTQFSISFVTGDWIISNGTAWEKVDLTDAVSSVFGRTGAVVGVSTDYSAVGFTNTAIGASSPSTGSFTSLSSSSTTTLNGTTIPASKTLVVTTDKLSALAATTSAELAGVISDETGSGSLVFANSPTLVSPALGAATATSINGVTVTGTGTPALSVTGTTAVSGTNTGDQTITLTGGVTGSGTGSFAATVVTNANLTGAITSVGNATSLGSFTSANLASALTDETGSGALVFATSPTLVTPILGTPQSGTLTSCTGLPISTGVSGLGTGVATALAVNVGSAGAPVVNGGALGTPSSGTVTNLTGTASININGTVGATTPSTVAATTGTFTTTSGSPILSVISSDNNGDVSAQIKSTGSTGSSQLIFSDTAATSGKLLYRHADDSLAVETGGAERARFTSTGLNSTAIGATTPSTGAFTTLSATGNTAIGTGTSNINGNNRGFTVQAAQSGATSAGIEASGFRSGSDGAVAQFIGLNGSTILSLFDIRRAGADNTGRWDIYLNNAGSLTKYGEWSTTGLAVTGTLSATGNVGVGGVAVPTGYNLATNTSGANTGGKIGTTSIVTSTSDYPYVGYNLRATNSSNSYNYDVTDTASALNFYNGGFRFFTAPSGTAGNPITFTERMNLTTTGLQVTGALSSTTGANFATSSGNVGIGTASPSTVYRTTINGDGSSVVGGLSLRNNGTETLTIGNITANNNVDIEIWNPRNGYLRFATNNAERLRIDSSGNVRFNAYGAGALTTDASGNITAASDERIKKNIRPFSRGLAEILAINPILHGYTEESGLDQTRDDYAGFSAQQVQALIPEAIGANADGMLSFSDRPVMAALVNAVKELTARLAALESK